MASTPRDPSGSPTVQRQITLPLSKAVEIAYKSIRLRLSRSLLVTSGIVLALAFLMSILASDAMTTSMRSWAERQSGAGNAQLSQRRDELSETLRAQERDLREQIAAAGAPAEGAAPFDAEATLGQSWAAIQQQLGALPATPGDLDAALTVKPDLLPEICLWLERAHELHVIKDELTAPLRLQALMQANGVPTDPAEIQANAIQTRWLLGLALLVAFVGILNAMLMSVTERFREIGTMKCLGALDSFIIKLFLIESMFQGFVGTVIGVALGLLLSLVATWLNYSEFAWKNPPYGQLAASIGICLLVGVGLTVAGAVYPAWQAARMQPIEAMRVET